MVLRNYFMTKLKTINDYKNPFDAITEFEHKIANYTGSPYVVTTDSCTHAIELCFRYYLTHTNCTKVTFPERTYLSVPMIFKILDIPYTLLNTKWHGEYNFGFTNIWDSARKLTNNMYKPSQMQCLSFGRTKPLEIGRGGAILLDDIKAYKWLKRASYDGRDLSFNPWQTQQIFNTGYHYMLRPEEAVDGLNKLNNNEVIHSYTHVYPNLSDIQIK